MSIVYIKAKEDLYFCYKYKPTIITGPVDNKYIDNINRSSPTVDDEGNLSYNCYIIRKYKGKIIDYKTNNLIFVVDDKLARISLGFTDFRHIISEHIDLFDMTAYKMFEDLCRKWANPNKWLYELEYLKQLNEVITIKTLNALYIDSRVDVWDYINNIGKNNNNYKTILSLDSNNLWYLFITKDVLTSVKRIDSQVISYFELLKLRVIENKLSIKFALIYLEIYVQTRKQL